MPFIISHWLSQYFYFRNIILIVGGLYAYFLRRISQQVVFLNFTKKRIYSLSFISFILFQLSFFRWLYVCIMYKIPVFGKSFFFLVTVAMITENVAFSSFHNDRCKRKKFIYHNHAAYQPWKNRVKQLKATQNKYFLGFYYHLSYIWVSLICWTSLVFSNPLDGGYFVHSEPR